MVTQLEKGYLRREVCIESVSVLVGSSNVLIFASWI